MQADDKQPINNSQTTIQGNVNTVGGMVNTGVINTGGGAFVGRDQINKYYTSPPVELPPEECAELLATYRQIVLRETKFFNLAGIPIPLVDMGHALELTSLYIPIQVLEQRHTLALQQEERATLREQWRTGRGQSGLAHAAATQDYYHGEVPEKPSGATPTAPDEAIRKHKQMMFTGETGSGKSTLLRYLAYQMASAKDELLPVLFPLRFYQQADGPNTGISLREQALRYAVDNDDRLLAALRWASTQGKIVWIFDGLDETSDDTQEQFCHQITRFGSQEHIVVSSRPGQPQGSGLEDFKRFNLMSVTAQNSEKFVSDWLARIAQSRNLPKSWIADRHNWLQTQLSNKPHLRMLIRNPLWLTIFVVMAGDEPRDDFPEQRHELHQSYIEALMERERNRNQANTSLRQELYTRGLYAISWYLHLAQFDQPTNRVDGDIPFDYESERSFVQQQLAKYLVTGEEEAQKIVDFWLGTGLLEEQRWAGRRLLSFCHLTFQEYGVARALHHVWERDRERTWAFLRLRLNRDAWKEPLVLFAGLLKRQGPSDLIRRILNEAAKSDKILHTNLRLAAALAGENRCVERKLVRKIVRQLSRLASGQLWPRSALMCAVHIVCFCLITWIAFNWGNILLASIIGIALAAIWVITIGLLWLDPVRYLLEIPQRWFKTPPTRIPFIEAMGALRSVEAYEPLKQLIENRWVSASDVTTIQIACIEALGQIGSKPAIDLLIQYIEGNPSQSVQSAAADALVYIGRDAVKPLIELLSNDSGYWHQSAAQILGRIGDERALPALIRELHSPSEGNIYAAQAIGTMGSEKAIPALISAICDANFSPDVRYATGDALAKIGTASVVPLLAALSQYSDSYQATNMLDALGKIGSATAAEPLVQFLCDNVGKEFHTANPLSATSSALIKIGVPVVFPLLKKLHQYSEIEKFCREVEHILHDLGESAMPSLIEFVESINWEDTRHPAFHRAVISLLGKMEQWSLPYILSKVKNDSASANLRSQLIDLLREIGEAEHVPLLLSLLNHLNSHIRGQAAHTLGFIGGQQAIDILYPMQFDEDEYVRQSVQLALTLLQRVSFSDSAKYRKRSISNQARFFVLSDLNTQTAQELLEILTEQSDDDRRAKAIEILGERKSIEAVEPLINVLANDYNLRMRVYAARALGEMGDNRATESLIIALDHTSENLGAAVAKALGQIRDHRAVTSLIKVASNVAEQPPSLPLFSWGGQKQTVLRFLQSLSQAHYPVYLFTYRVRFYALIALGNIGNPEALPCLLHHTRDVIPEIRRAAVIALERMASQLSQSQRATVKRYVKRRLRDTVLIPHEGSVAAAAFYTLEALEQYKVMDIAIDDLLI